MNSFWDTVKGQNLADVLIKTLPRLAKKKKQYIKAYTSASDAFYEFEEGIQQELNSGSRIVAMTHNVDGYIYIVYEREE